MSYAVILIPGTGIADAYASKQEFNNAVGIYLATWFIFTMLMTYASLHSLMTSNVSNPNHHRFLVLLR
jgi:succinate-acetate transporter protein